MRNSSTPLRAVVVALVAAALSVSVAAQLPAGPSFAPAAAVYALD